MPLDYKFQPLEGSFPRDLTPDSKRDSSPFGKTWTQVQEILERELRMLSYRTGSVILQTAHSPWDVRKDGKLRSEVRKPEHPGVVLKFDVYNEVEKKYELLSFECDQFADWKSNVRAIADALEALRKVNRYGVSGGGKTDAHYEGYKALPSGETGLTDDLVSDVVLAAYLETHSGLRVKDILASKEIFKRAYKRAAAKLHPDNKQTGDTKAFLHLQKITELLEKNFN